MPFPMRTSVLLFAATCSIATLHAQYSGPESVEFDPIGDRYFVSNTQSSSIKVRSQAGVVTDFATSLPTAPYGLEIMGTTLYAAMGGSVRGYDLATGDEVFVRNLSASFLNGITTDGTYLYLTDFSATRIYKVDVAGNSHTTLVANTAGTPNGIVYDAVGDRLVVAFWGSNAPVKSFDRETGAATTLVTTALGSIDGITIDCFGNFLLASWSPDRITRYDPAFALPAENMNVPDLNNPADIDFDIPNGRICIPNSGSNTVQLFEINCTTGIAEEAVGEAFRVVPNPGMDMVRLEPALTKAEPYILLDARGLLIGGGTLHANSWLDISDLRPGMYIIHLTRSDRKVRLVKE